jgi:bifunctional DNase/RNase
VRCVGRRWYAPSLMLEQAGQQRSIDIRPSGAVALALPTESPIYVAEAVLDQAGIVPQQSARTRSPSPSGAPREAIDESKLRPFKECIETLETL